MATEAPATEKEVKVKRRRRMKPSAAREVRYWKKGDAPKSPGRPKGALTSPIMTVSGLLARCFRDLEFQNTMIWRYQTGRATPKEIEMMFHFVEGRPGYKLKIEVASDPAEEAERERLRRMDPAMLSRENDLLRELAALRTRQMLPQATVVSTETTQDAEVVVGTTPEPSA